MLGAAAAGSAKLLAFATLLDAHGFGQYSLALLVFQIASYLGNAGLSEGLAREVPILLGQGKADEAETARKVAVRASLWSAGCLGALASLVAVPAAFYNADYGPLLWVGLLVTTSVPCNLLLIDLAGRTLSSQYALMLLTKNLCGLAAGAVGILLFGVAGGLIGEALANAVTAIVIIAIYSRDTLRSIPRGSFQQAVKIARIGVPFMLSSIVLSFTLAIDRWFVHARFGLSVLGEYSFVFLMFTAGTVITGIVSVYVHPRIVRRCSQTGDRQAAFAFVGRLAVIIAATFCIAAIPVLLTLDCVFDLWFPQYAASKPLLLPVYFSTMFWTMNFYGALFVIRGDGRIPFWLSVGNGIVCAVAFAIATFAGASVLTFAMIYVAGRALYFFCCVVTAKIMFRDWVPTSTQASVLL